MTVILIAPTWAQQKTQRGAGESIKPDLVMQYAKMSCAVVQITHPFGAGTGVFITAEGDLLTAAHVVLDRSFSVDTKENLITTVKFKPGLQYRKEGRGVEPITTRDPTPQDVERATADLAVIQTGKKTDCFIPVGDSSTLKVGEAVTAIGYPNLSPSGALYQGFVSSRYKHLAIPVGFVGSRPVYPQYEVLRIQMPITPGASGSPVIDGQDKIVGIISEVPVVWANDLSDLIQMVRKGGSGVTIAGFDTVLLLAKLAWIVHEFESPGAGLAVPVSYLKPPAPLR